MPFTEPASPGCIATLSSTPAFAFSASVTGLANGLAVLLVNELTIGSAVSAVVVVALCQVGMLAAPGVEPITGEGNCFLWETSHYETKWCCRDVKIGSHTHTHTHTHTHPL